MKTSFEIRCYAFAAALALNLALAVWLDQLAAVQQAPQTLAVQQPADTAGG
jgi:hypothetical protein